jgi:nicotinamidase/pyrazinamidase
MKKPAVTAPRNHKRETYKEETCEDVQIMEKRTIFWDTDTQYDFMMPQGKLYVPGADQIIGAVSDVRATALDHGCSILASQDWHIMDNPEISETPDHVNTFPPHCMAGTPGAARVGYLGKLSIDYVGLEPRNPGELEGLVQPDQFHIVIRKDAISIFSNPNSMRLLDLLMPARFIVFGVAFDVCVEDTLRNLAKWPGVELVLVKDATKGMGVKPEDQVYHELQSLGVDITESSLLCEMMPCG